MKHPRTHSTPVPFSWPATPFHVALVEPEIPPNTGNVARLCAATGTVLHLVEPLGFQLTDRHLKRAGLDYWDSVRLERHVNLQAFVSACGAPRRFFFSTRGRRLYTEAQYQPGDALIFGSETRGLPEALLNENADSVFSIPLRPECVRSLNLANAVSIVLYEALRQCAAACPATPAAGDAP